MIAIPSSLTFLRKVFRLSRFDRDQWVQLSITGSSPDDGLRLTIVDKTQP